MSNRKRITAADVECPKCGQPFQDVEHSFPIEPEPDSVGYVSTVVWGHCVFGHAVKAQWVPNVGLVVNETTILVGRISPRAQ